MASTKWDSKIWGSQSIKTNIIYVAEWRNLLGYQHKIIHGFRKRIKTTNDFPQPFCFIWIHNHHFKFFKVSEEWVFTWDEWGSVNSSAASVRCHSPGSAGTVCAVWGTSVSRAACLRGHTPPRTSSPRFPRGWTESLGWCHFSARCNPSFPSLCGPAEKATG